ncbi:hypothetical protein O181_130405 [Austropuccinia psidii MF-1]|uniref:Uncharacterized protein n=1 Tax=Austropuccinia psidii MF-1 TaxID=1389203 RepID=A0A9Q3QAY3_9BASI|nr:hypothetical protein [Austropuccinia psidii MF-1]
MEAAIQSNQMDLGKEEVRPQQGLPNHPQERHIWRMPELPPILQEAIEIYQSQYKNWFREAKEEQWEICPSLWKGAMKSYLHIKRFLGQEKTIEISGGLSPFYCKDKVEKIKNGFKSQSFLSSDQKKEFEMTPVVSTSSKPAPEASREKPKGPQKKEKGPKNHQEKGKGNANWHRPYPQVYWIPKFEPSAVDSVFNMARTLMEFTAKEQERMNRALPPKY